MVIIGLSGVAGAGKNFFSSNAVEFLEGRGLTVRTVAFAEDVKYQLGDFVSSFYGFSSFTENRELKSIIRPLMVSFAEGMKEIHGQDYWVNSTKKRIEQYSFADVVIITDVRFPIELSTLRLLNGSLIHISRFINKDGIKIQVLPFNELEKKNDPIMSANADLKITWPTISLYEAYEHVSTFLSDSENIWNKQSLIS